jgi:hypothetical protein
MFSCSLREKNFSIKNIPLQKFLTETKFKRTRVFLDVYKIRGRNFAQRFAPSKKNMFNFYHFRFHFIFLPRFDYKIIVT